MRHRPSFPKYTHRLPKQKTQAGNTRWILLPALAPAHFLLGRVGGGRDPLLPGHEHPTARVRQRVHSPTQRTQLLGGDPREPEGSAAGGGGGTSAGKDSCGYRDARPGAWPPPPRPSTRAHWSQGPAPPRGRVLESPAPSRLHWPARLPLHVHPGCYLGCPSGARLLLGVGLGS